VPSDLWGPQTPHSAQPLAGASAAASSCSRRTLRLPQRRWGRRGGTVGGGNRFAPWAHRLLCGGHRGILEVLIASISTFKSDVISASTFVHACKHSLRIIIQTYVQTYMRVCVHSRIGKVPPLQCSDTNVWSSSPTHLFNACEISIIFWSCRLARVISFARDPLKLLFGVGLLLYGRDFAHLILFSQAFKVTGSVSESQSTSSQPKTAQKTWYISAIAQLVFAPDPACLSFGVLSGTN
jgi:hypothetical protein